MGKVNTQGPKARKLAKVHAIDPDFPLEVRWFLDAIRVMQITEAI